MGKLVSIIVPVYNAGPRLQFCLESIRHQSYDDFEALLVDDGSTDGSGAVCDQFAAADPRFRVIHQANQGISAAQNAGLDRAQGDYITFSDNDDILTADNFEALVHAMEQTGADLAKGRWEHVGDSELESVAERAKASRIVDESGQPPVLTVFENPFRVYQSIFPKTQRLLGGRRAEALYFNEGNWCKLYHRQVWQGLRFPVGRFGQDIAVAGQLLSRCTRVVDVNRVLYFWVQAASSVSHSRKTALFYHDNFLAGLENFELALELGITPARSFYAMVAEAGRGQLQEKASDAAEPGNQAQLAADRAAMRAAIARLSPHQRLRCSALTRLRLAENIVYDRTLHVKA